MIPPLCPSTTNPSIDSYHQDRFRSSVIMTTMSSSSSSCTLGSNSQRTTTTTMTCCSKAVAKFRWSMLLPNKKILLSGLTGVVSLWFTWCPDACFLGLLVLVVSHLLHLLWIVSVWMLGNGCRYFCPKMHHKFTSKRSQLYSNIQDEKDGIARRLYLQNKMFHHAISNLFFKHPLVQRITQMLGKKTSSEKEASWQYDPSSSSKDDDTATTVSVTSMDSAYCTRRRGGGGWHGQLPV